MVSSLSTYHSLIFFSMKKNSVKSVRIRSFSGPFFSLIRTEYGEILRICPYSVQLQENTDQKNYEYGHFSYREGKPNVCLYLNVVLDAACPSVSLLFKFHDKNLIYLFYNNSLNRVFFSIPYRRSICY